jgi:exopolysaccharide biosynthesis polyprenyl glycosylphosphotransferase
MYARDIALETPPCEVPGDQFNPEALAKPRKRWGDNAASDAVIASAVAGDCFVAFAALWLVSRLDLTGTARAIPFLHRGNACAMLGALALVAIFSSGNIYSRRHILHLQENLSCILRGGFLWSVFFIAIIAMAGGLSSATLSFGGAAAGAALGGLICWRLLLHRVARDERVAAHFRQRILLIGWTPEAGRLSQTVWQHRADPCEIVGYAELPRTDADSEAPANIPYLGGLDDLPGILEEHEIKTAWLTDINLDVRHIAQIAAQCEKEMVEFKIIPSYFPILLSAMHVEMLCGTPILGVDRLPLNYFLFRVLKRLADVAGAIAGLLITAPIMACFCAIVYAESPGPVFYRQTRMGRKGKPFQIIKIRSMSLDAEKNGKPGWTTRDDPRRLRIGGLMRKWNIDELPQFWNVLKGEMSLVGPRPERPELISNFKHEIEHYNARHSVKPGVTGWAQINGLRGDTDLTERIRHDIFYLEHWSLLFDLRIMLLTFFRHKNAC